MKNPRLCFRPITASERYESRHRQPLEEFKFCCVSMASLAMHKSLPKAAVFLDHVISRETTTPLTSTRQLLFTERAQRFTAVALRSIEKSEFAWHIDHVFTVQQTSRSLKSSSIT